MNEKNKRTILLDCHGNTEKINLLYFPESEHTYEQAINLSETDPEKVLLNKWPNDPWGDMSDENDKFFVCSQPWGDWDIEDYGSIGNMEDE